MEKRIEVRRVRKSACPHWIYQVWKAGRYVGGFVHIPTKEMIDWLVAHASKSGALTYAAENFNNRRKIPYGRRASPGRPKKAR